MSLSPRSNFIAVAELAAAKQAAVPLILLDLRFDPGKGAQITRYLDGHIPGALFVDLPLQLADTAVKGRGSNPLPDLAQLQESVRAWGIGPHSDIIVYDDTSGGPAGRAWWVLRWAGLTNVRILEGGLAAWKQARLPVEVGPSAPVVPGTATLSAGHLPKIEADEVRDTAQRGVLIDARPRTDFSGEGKAHIPGARSLPTSAVIDAAGTPLPAEQLRAVAAEQGIALDGPVAVYCGGGVASTLLIAALDEIGVEAALYPGAWSEWISDKSRPVEA
ncbi:sulfurtransferase [Roseococcus sp. YIM B11640]|uniref:sulfurtransferase n=1 Tax=Roseococcus sp. YIM B11640 TaxID=3133973 RepID=UPI003C797F3A